MKQRFENGKRSCGRTKLTIFDKLRKIVCVLTGEVDVDHSAGTVKFKVSWSIRGKGAHLNFDLTPPSQVGLNSVVQRKLKIPPPGVGVVGPTERNMPPGARYFSDAL